MAEARCPPPVSEERKRIFSAVGWFGGVVSRGAVCSVEVLVSPGVALVAVSSLFWGGSRDSSCSAEVEAGCVMSGEDSPRLNLRDWRKRVKRFGGLVGRVAAGIRYLLSDGLWLVLRVFSW